MMIIGFSVLAVIILYVVLIYNSLISKRNRIRESLAAIDVYLQNRFDALTKIAETVVAYAKHEKETLTQLTQLRERISTLPTSTEKMNQLHTVEEGLRNINVQAEAYPELQASQNFLHLQRTINEQEEKLSASRRTYNANVTSYNSYIASVPTNIIAGMLGFKERELLVIEDTKKADVDMRNLLGG